jgi:transposase
VSRRDTFTFHNPTFQFANTETEIANLVKQLQSDDLNLIVLEATGGLETELIIQLQAALLPVALINPRQGRDFAKATGKLAKTDATLVSDLPELGQLTAKQISRLVGVAPINHDSGQHKGKRMINGGRAHVRAILYMGAVVAMRHKECYQNFL